jgi:heme/copper-type cytochrome/quinol oxidase subunit 1
MSSHATAEVHGDNYINHSKGIMSWLGTLDHKRIGMMYLFTVLIFFLIGEFLLWECVWNYFLPACNT